MTDEDIIAQITGSRKYSFLLNDFVRRIAAEESPKYKKDKDKIKAVKNRLHQLYGAFFPDECHKKAHMLLDQYQSGNNITEVSERIAKLHVSTSERIGFVKEFYDYIFNNLVHYRSIADIGCGFNPFCLPWMPMNEIKEYYACDIDRRTSELVNRFFGLLKMPRLASDIDIIADAPCYETDAAFLFKLIPVLENQSQGRGYQVLEKIQAGNIAVTFPVRTLCGKDKGMETNYAEMFEKKLPRKLSILKKCVIGNELIYILSKKFI